jgi:HD superfamily phosphodiesterase
MKAPDRMADAAALRRWERVFSAAARKASKSAKKPSAAHGADHSRRVWGRAKALCKAVGGDPEVLVAAAYLHDLARHGGHVIHGRRSARLAKPVLEEAGFPKEKAALVLEAISVHDWQTPDRMRKTLESMILYDCDKMDAFGAVGVKRHLLYFNYHGKGDARASEILRLIERKWRSLCLGESRKIAREDFEYIAGYFKRLAREEADG